jgi:adenylate kinase
MTDKSAAPPQPGDGNEGTTVASTVKTVLLTDPESFVGKVLARTFGAAGYAITDRPATQDALLERCLASDVIVLDVQRGGCEEAKALIQSLSTIPTAADLTARPKTLIVLSTVMTWAATPHTSDSEDGGDDGGGDGGAAPAASADGDALGDAPALAEEDFRRRKAHANYKKQLFIEKYALKMKREGIRAYVVCAGLQYGGGEDVLHWLFRTAWQGDAKELPIIGTASGDAEAVGRNIVPAIHVNDLAAIVARVAESPPEEDRYILAVDSAACSLRDMATAISTKLGTGKVRPMPPEEAMLIKGITQREIDMLQVNLRMESLVCHELLGGDSGDSGEVATTSSSSTWVSEAGFVENIDLVVKQYRETRGLTPVRVVVLGAPATGKTEISKAIAKHYGLHHLLAKDIIDEVLAADSELAAEVASARDSTGRIPDEQLAAIFRKKLHGWQCQNQGYVLDGFPKNANQAALLFSRSGDDDDGKGEKGSDDGTDPLIVPDHVLMLEADDTLLRKRVMAMPQSRVEGTHNTEEGFARRLARWRAENRAEEGVAQWMEAHSLLPVPIDVSNAQISALLDLIAREIGSPHGYGPSAEELEERRREAERTAKEAAEAERCERERQEAREREERAAAQMQWQKRLGELRSQEAELLQARSLPFRTYLMDTVMPTLTKALVELSEVRPDDPIDYLAEYLLRASLK